MSNLMTRFLDFDHSVSPVSITDIKTGDAVPVMTKHKKKKTFFVVLSRVEGYEDFIGDLVAWCQKAYDSLVYGVHFNAMEEDVSNQYCNRFPVDAKLNFSSCQKRLNFLLTQSITK